MLTILVAAVLRATACSLFTFWRKTFSKFYRKHKVKGLVKGTSIFNQKTSNGEKKNLIQTHPNVIINGETS
jgi:hypothetical protein